jgi:hypothetical protein
MAVDTAGPAQRGRVINVASVLAYLALLHGTAY